jgi:hypothetical protein
MILAPKAEKESFAERSARQARAAAQQAANPAN